MDNRQFLITSITLLYRESQQENTTANSAGIIGPLIDTISLPDVGVGVIDTERELLTRLKLLVKEMCSNPPGTGYDFSEVAQKVSLTCKEETYLYSSFELGAKDKLPEFELAKSISGLRKSIRSYKDEKEITKVLSDASRNLMFKRNEIPCLSTFAMNIMEAMMQFRRGGDDKDPAIVSTVDSGDPNSFAEVLTRAQELNDPRGIMVTGWQGLNNMLGGGIRRGECILTSALQHNFKTGSGLSLFWQLPFFNKPWMIDESKKPMMVRISFEDPLELNIPFLYRNIYENNTLKKADLGIPASAMAEYVISNMSRNGYHIRMLHVNPSEWTYLDLLDYTNALEAQGFEIHLLMCDYLAMLPKTGLDNNGPIGASTRELFRRVRNHYSARKTTFITPHQLSTEAKMLVRNGLEEEFVKEIANKGYYDGCKTIDQEVDCEIHFHKVVVDGKSYLTVQRGKHRLIQQTDDKYKYTVLPFHDVGDIRVDLGGPDSSMRRPGFAPRGQEGGDAPFWAYDQSHMNPATQTYTPPEVKSQVIIGNPDDPSRAAETAKEALPEKKAEVIISVPGYDLEIKVGSDKAEQEPVKTEVDEGLEGLEVISDKLENQVMDIINDIKAKANQQIVDEVNDLIKNKVDEVLEEEYAF